MLVLTRRIEEKVTIGDEIIVTILDVNGRQIKLGIDAPKQVKILREELLTSHSHNTAQTKQNTRINTQC